MLGSGLMAKITSGAAFRTLDRISAEWRETAGRMYVYVRCQSAIPAMYVCRMNVQTCTCSVMHMHMHMHMYMYMCMCMHMHR